jgi:hypothetical protein
MKRPLALSALALAATLVGAACSSKSSAPFDPGLCARVSACFPTASASFGEGCELLWAELQVEAQGGLGTADDANLGAVQCVANAADCAAMKACTQATTAQAAVCTGSGTLQACSGDVLVGCGSTSTAVDCAAAGTHCIAGTTPGTAGCGTAACDMTTTQPSCDGDLLVKCINGVLRSTTCAYAVDTSCSGTGTGPETCTTTVGNTCGVVGGTAQCVGAGASCDPSTFPSGCDGTVVQSCTGGKIGRFDCAQWGPELTCTTDPNASFSFSCGNVATQCTSSTPESCNGSVLTYCWFGAVSTVDCKSYGLSGCATTTQNGATTAHCTE